MQFNELKIRFLRGKFLLMVGVLMLAQSVYGQSYRKGEELKVPFKVLNGTLNLIAWSPIDPIEAALQLVYVGSSRKTINHLSELKGLVKITTPKQALAFVRLRTSPKTFFLLMDRMSVEVANKNEINLDFMFGDKHELSFVKSMQGDGYCGIITPETAKRLNLRFAQVKTIKEKKRQGYEITRPILVEDYNMFSHQRTFHIVEMVEFVSHDGDYTVSEKELIKDINTTKVWWSIPTFK